MQKIAARFKRAGVCQQGARQLFSLFRSLPLSAPSHLRLVAFYNVFSLSIAIVCVSERNAPHDYTARFTTLRQYINILMPRLYIHMESNAQS